MGCNSELSIDVQGHRGCRGLYPENSLPAFKKAIELGVTTLELDIAISKDKKVVVTHEPYMNALICLDQNGNEFSKAEGKGFNIYKMDYATIKQFDCGLKFHPTYPEQKKLKTYKPLLKEVFDLVNALQADVNFNIEIKSEEDYYGIYTPHPKTYVELVLLEIISSGLKDKVNLQSFDLNILEEIKIQDPKMPVALLVDEDEDIFEKIKGLSYEPKIISPNFKLLNQNTIQILKAREFVVIPWTVNAKEDMSEMIVLGVDGIITDYPNRLLELVRN